MFKQCVYKRPVRFTGRLFVVVYQSQRHKKPMLLGMGFGGLQAAFKR